MARDYDPPHVESFMNRYADEARSLLRIVAALLFFLHGTSKLFGFPPYELGVPNLFSTFWIAGVLEIIGGSLLIVGLFSRPVAFLLSGEMAVAYWIFHAPRSTFPTENLGEGAILFCFIFLFIAAAGPGPWSLDAKMSARRRGDVIDEDRAAEPTPGL